MARSKAYPVLALEPAVDAVLTVLEELGKGAHDRDSVAQALGYGKGHGLAARKVAALVQYGLLTLSQAGYAPSPLAERLWHPVDANERNHALVEACTSPTLFHALLQRYAEDGQVPGALRNILVREYGITSKAATDAAKNFIESARFAGLLDGENRFRTAQPEHDSDAEPVSSGSPVATDSQRRTENPAQPRGGPGRQPGEAAPGSQSFQLALSTGTARLELPARITRKDLAKLRKLVELLELGIEEEEG